MLGSLLQILTFRKTKFIFVSIEKKLKNHPIRENICIDL